MYFLYGTRYILRKCRHNYNRYHQIDEAYNYEGRMNSQKVENQLNLALDTPVEIRNMTDNLNVGYIPEQKAWELIVRYEGSLNKARILGATVTELINNYAIVVAPENVINTLANLEEIIYIEKPKRLNFAIENGKRVSCIDSVQETLFDLNESLDELGLNLTGEGCILGIIDSGIDYSHKDFLNDNGETRILELWDQSVELSSARAPVGYNIGALYTKEQIDRALRLPATERQREVESEDISGHGTAVASIAAAVAPKAELIVVKLGVQERDGFPRTTQLMQAIDFCVKKGLEYGRPIAINISFGNNYGSHDGTSLLSTFIDSASNIGRNIIVIGTGNEGSTSLHTSGTLLSGGQESVELAVGRFEKNISIQLWKMYGDEFRITLVSPGGVEILIEDKRLTSFYVNIGENILLIYAGEPAPYSLYQEIYVEFIPREEYIEDGVWRIDISAGKIIDGRFDMWLSGDRISNSTRFNRPVAETTLTIPSTSSKAISVGAYDSYNFSYAHFSGRGFTRATNQIKPDIVAPGVNILAAAPGGGSERKTGTSFATPFVTGSGALMMEWGIIKDNDRYLYGEKVKAYLIKGARRLRGFDVWPNPQLGWGALCLEASLPLERNV